MFDTPGADVLALLKFPKFADTIMVLIDECEWWIYSCPMYLYIRSLLVTCFLSDSGGTCVCNTSDLCVTDSEYLSCVEEVRKDMITATAASAALASFLLGLLNSSKTNRCVTAPDFSAYPSVETI